MFAYTDAFIDITEHLQTTYICTSLPKVIKTLCIMLIAQQVCF